MNWLGAGIRSLLASILGCVLGAWLVARLRSYGLDFPPLAGLIAGLATALFSTEKSGPRGIVVASLSVWSTAVAEVLHSPRRGFLLDLVAFHERLHLFTVLAYIASAVLATVLASRAWAVARATSEQPSEAREKNRPSSLA